MPLSANSGQFGPVLRGGPVTTGFAVASRFAFAFLPMDGKFTTATRCNSEFHASSDQECPGGAGTVERCLLQRKFSVYRRKRPGNEIGLFRETGRAELCRRCVALVEDVVELAVQLHIAVD